MFVVTRRIIDFEQDKLSMVVWLLVIQTIFSANFFFNLKWLKVNWKHILITDFFSQAKL